MQHDAVVKANDVVSDIVYGLEMIGLVLLSNPLHLQIKEETLWQLHPLRQGWTCGGLRQLSI